MKNSQSCRRISQGANHSGVSGLGLLPSLVGGALVGLLVLAVMLLGTKLALRGEIVPDISSIIVTSLGLANIFFGLIVGGVSHWIQVKTRHTIAAGTVPLFATLGFLLTFIVVITCCRASDTGEVNGANLHRYLLWTTVLTYSGAVCLLVAWSKRAKKRARK